MTIKKKMTTFKLRELKQELIKDKECVKCILTKILKSSHFQVHVWARRHLNLEPTQSLGC